jgi:hypothetical protein
MQVDGRLPTGQKYGDVEINSLTASSLDCILIALFTSCFEGRMFSCWIVTNIISARRTLHRCKTSIPCGDQLLICGLYNKIRIGKHWYDSFPVAIGLKQPL